MHPALPFSHPATLSGRRGVDMYLLHLSRGGKHQAQVAGMSFRHKLLPLITIHRAFQTQRLRPFAGDMVDGDDKFQIQLQPRGGISSRGLPCGGRVTISSLRSRALGAGGMAGAVMGEFFPPCAHLLRGTSERYRGAEASRGSPREHGAMSGRPHGR